MNFVIGKYYLRRSFGKKLIEGILRNPNNEQKRTHKKKKIIETNK